MNRPNMKGRKEDEYYREFDNIYINLHKNKTIYTPGDTNASFDVQNDSPILDDASEYYCSVIRFDLPLSGIPIKIAPVLPFPNVDPNILLWEVGIKLNNVLFRQRLVYVPEYRGLPITAVSPGLVPIIPTIDYPAPHKEYWFIYEYSTIINMLNIALDKACAAAGIAAPRPYFFIDYATELISVVVPTSFTTIPVTPSETPINVPTRPEIYMNTSLFNLFGSFPFYAVTTPNPSFGFYLSLNGFYFPPRTNNAYYLAASATAPTAPPTAFVFTQEYPILHEWSDLKDILFMSNKLPLNAESLTTDNGFNTTRIPILTDFIPQFEKAADLKSTVYYNPTAQYRLTDLIATLPISSFDISIIWRSTYGDTFPLTINQGEEVNIKIGFLRKDLYKNHALEADGY